MNTVWTVHFKSPEENDEFHGVFATAELAKARVEELYKEDWPEALWYSHGKTRERMWIYYLTGERDVDTPCVFVEEWEPIKE